MDAYTKLAQLMDENPALIFENNGYENLPGSVVEAHKEAIAAIEAVLTSCIKGFVRFQNFKPRPDDTVAVRYQVWYNDEGSFTGVAYTPMESFRGVAA